MSEDDFDPNSWMVTFADLVMLLLTFFVLLLTMSSMDTKKLKNIMTHFRESTGVLELSGARPVSNLASFISQYNNSDSLLVVDQENFLAKKQIAIEIKDILKEVNELSKEGVKHFRLGKQSDFFALDIEDMKTLLKGVSALKPKTLHIS